MLTRVDCLVAERLAPARVAERGKERHIMAAEAAAGLEALYETGCDAWRIGEVTEAGGVEFV